MLRAFLAAVTGLSAVALVASSAEAYDVQEIGSFHIGGKEVTIANVPPKEIQVANGPNLKYNINGQFQTGQMYVQYVKLKNTKSKYPVLLWHTGGASGVSWETKPDGQPGWQHYFLNAGHDVYVSDAVERGRSSWSRYPEVFKSEPYFRDKKEAWEIFRIGPEGGYSPDPAKRVANPGQLFPLSAFDQVNKQIVPRWATNDDAIQSAYNELVSKVCPCVIIAHGQAGGFAFRSALANPDKVKGIVAIETPYPPEADKTDLTGLKKVPQLFVWGDYMDTHSYWKNAFTGRPRLFYEAVKKMGAKAEWLDLPAAGIKGNTHMVMMDSNSDVVAGRVQSWMSQQGFMNR